MVAACCSQRICLGIWKLDRRMTIFSFSHVYPVALWRRCTERSSSCRLFLPRNGLIRFCKPCQRAAWLAVAAAATVLQVVNHFPNHYELTRKDQQRRRVALVVQICSQVDISLYTCINIMYVYIYIYISWIFLDNMEYFGIRSHQYP